MKVTTTCPVCNHTLIVTDTSDPSVGIFFDYDVLEGSECTCDWDDDKTVDTISEHVQKAIEDAIYGEPEDYIVEYETERI